MWSDKLKMNLCSVFWYLEGWQYDQQMWWQPFLWICDVIVSRFTKMAVALLRTFLFFSFSPYRNESWDWFPCLFLLLGCIMHTVEISNCSCVALDMFLNILKFIFGMGNELGGNLYRMTMDNFLMIIWHLYMLTM